MNARKQVFASDNPHLFLHEIYLFYLAWNVGNTHIVHCRNAVNHQAVLIGEVKSADERHMYTNILNVSSWVIYREFSEYFVE